MWYWCLELKESHYKQDDYVYKKFKKQRKRNEEGTGLVWKEGNLPLGNNKNGRLKSLVRKEKEVTCM